MEKISEREVKVGDVMRRGIEATADSAELIPVKQEFYAVAEKLEEISSKILAQYKAICSQNNFNPGKVELYAVGGRITGKPLKTDSDIDLIFVVENTADSPETPQFKRFADATDAMILKNELHQEMLKSINGICRELHVPNKFHLLTLGVSGVRKESLLLASGD